MEVYAGVQTNGPFKVKKHKLISVGTIRKNKRNISKALFDVRNRDISSCLFAFHENITAVSYF